MMVKHWWRDPDWWAVTFDEMLRNGAKALIFALGADALNWFRQWWQILATVGFFVIGSFATSIIVAPKVAAGKRLGDDTEVQLPS